MKKNPLFYIIFAIALVDLTLFTLPVKASQLLLEEKVVNTAIRLYRYINTPTNEDGTKKFRFPNPGEELSTPSCWWGVHSIKHEEDYIVTLIMKKGIKPSVALHDLLNKGGVIDCFIALSIVNQSIALKLTGKSLFNFANKQAPFCMPSISVIGLDDPFTTRTTPALSGEYGHIQNIPSYREIHPHGFASGQNVYCVNINGELRYLGFGDLFKNPPTEQEILDELYQDTIEPINETDLKVRTKQNAYKSNRSLWETERLNQIPKYSVYRFSRSEVEMLKRQFVDYIAKIKSAKNKYP
jgi:hypothetical protein